MPRHTQSNPLSCKRKTKVVDIPRSRSEQIFPDIKAYYKAIVLKTVRLSIEREIHGTEQRDWKQTTIYRDLY